MLPIAKYFDVSIEQLVGERPIERIENATNKKSKIQGDKEWSPELYIKCISLACDAFKQRKHKVSAEQALEVIKEIYFYALHREQKEIDSIFVG